VAQVEESEAVTENALIFRATEAFLHSRVNALRLRCRRTARRGEARESASRTNGTIRGAIYTGKSTDEGLEQEFNSLDAQRESAEAYIASQRHEGWVCTPDRFADGGHRLFKRPVTAERFVTDKAFAELLTSMDNRAALLLGHTRWRTRGDERVNSNNRPIRAGEVIGTHNGTIYNANHLFRRWKMRRFAEVDIPIADFGLEISEVKNPFRTLTASQIRNPQLKRIPAARRFSTLRTPRTSTPCWRRKKAGGSFRSRP